MLTRNSKLFLRIIEDVDCYAILVLLLGPFSVTSAYSAFRSFLRKPSLYSLYSCSKSRNPQPNSPVTPPTLVQSQYSLGHLFKWLAVLEDVASLANVDVAAAD